MDLQIISEPDVSSNAIEDESTINGATTTISNGQADETTTISNGQVTTSDANDATVTEEDNISSAIGIICPILLLCFVL